VRLANGRKGLLERCIYTPAPSLRGILDPDAPQRMVGS